MKNCPVKDTCGGCRYIGISYEEGLEDKQKQLSLIYGNRNLQPIVPMDNPYHYRHKVYASFGYSSRHHLAAGMYEEDSHEKIYSDNCLIQNETANRILSVFCQTAGKMHIEPYEEDTGRGVLRHLYLRVSHATGKVMLVIVIGSRELPGSRELCSVLRKKCPEISTIILNYNSRHTSMVLGPKEKILYGPGVLYDSIDGIRFRISSRSFFQVNPVQTQVLYAEALKLADLKSDEKVLDLCCGIGTISLLAARQAASVIGVEIVKEAVQDAVFNAENNQIRNVRFLCHDAEQYLADMRTDADTVFLDPVRAGFTEIFLKNLAHAHAKKIIYISCNPVTHARDIAVLEHSGYHAETIVPVDLFPFTAHVEAIALLQKNSK